MTFMRLAFLSVYNKNGFPHDILTLDPNKFAEKKQQCLHIGNLVSFSPRISLLKQRSPVSVDDIMYHAPTRFPSGTKAFLYYSMSPEKSRIDGELRLRVTSSDGPASFESGSDLLRPNVASTYSYFKTLSFFVWKFEGRWNDSEQLGHSFGCFSLKTTCQTSSFS